VLRAAALAQKELGRVKVLVIGGGSEMAALRALAADEGLDVEFAGQTDVWQWLPRAHVMVNSSLEAPALDVVNLEAYVAGLPVVAYGGNGLPETVRDGETGTIVTPGDWQGLSEAIVALARDAALRERYAAAGQRLVEESYLYERQVEAMRAAYEFALRRGRSGA
jgi:glycosyltransferase involved in cell wall biosynthesis